MKLNRRHLRRLIESILNEQESKEYMVPGYRDRPAYREYTIDHKGNELVLDTFDAGSKIIITFYDIKDEDGNPKVKKYSTMGVKTSIPWPYDTPQKVRLSSQM